MKDDILTQCHEILDKWKKVSQTAGILIGNNASSGEDMNIKLVRIRVSATTNHCATNIHRGGAKDM
jgi:hypothetical protein